MVSLEVLDSQHRFLLEMPLHGHHRQRHRQALVALLQLLKSLLDSHYGTSVLESADSVRKVPVASKQRGFCGRSVQRQRQLDRTQQTFDAAASVAQS
jgi:hypothetical protein